MPPQLWTGKAKRRTEHTAQAMRKKSANTSLKPPYKIMTVNPLGAQGMSSGTGSVHSCRLSVCFACGTIVEAGQDLVLKMASEHRYALPCPLRHQFGRKQKFIET